MQLPDYPHSLLALANSIRAHFGLRVYHATLPVLDRLLTDKPQKVVLMLFDGMSPEPPAAERARKFLKNLHIPLAIRP